MKNVLFVLFVAASLSSCAVQQALPEDLTTHELIFDFPGSDKATLYHRANSWLAETFVSAETVIDYQDKEAGRIIGKFTSRARQGNNVGDTRQTVAIDVKDEMARIRFSNPQFRPTYNSLAAGFGILAGDYDAGSIHGAKYRPVHKAKTMEDIKEQWNTLVSDYRVYLSTPDDWAEN